MLPYDVTRSQLIQKSLCWWIRQAGTYSAIPTTEKNVWYIDGLVQDHSNSIANALELLQSCTKQSICDIQPQFWNHYASN